MSKLFYNMSFAEGWNQNHSCLGRRLDEIHKLKQQLYYKQQKLSTMSKGILTIEEIKLLKEKGINCVQFWAVVYAENATPLAIFDSRENAEKWKAEMCATAIIEPYALQIKN